MRNRNSYLARTCGIGLALIAVFAVWAAFAEGNIDSWIAKYAWSENSGWQNWHPTDGGVTVVNNGTNGYLYGYAWGENIGWVKLGVSNGPYANTDTNNYGVNMDASGKLSGYAWSETCGWISFSNTYSQVSITANSFDGYAWAENVGFVHFKNGSPAYNVALFPKGTFFFTY
ncbi:MAG: hypothetical protein KKE37_12475 [Verrucomicrobia bacterium]|nr:hypothetical protein [Verrucomicrobiota bacterium]MBU4289636.1 hypothetical protein [Verrucomicrobiota bacterium]MBU4430153.1 hypothetical protein [Verrucomicrobiota bacterium]MCG2679499.1 hypothetical protein [Kiritimatiellia bacterium]